MKIQVAKACIDGIKRKGNNQDAVGLALPESDEQRAPLLLVADGMGGPEGGAVASRIVVQAFMECYHSTRDLVFPRFFHTALNEAHRRVREQAQKQANLAAMGTTVVAAAVTAEKIFIINVGDSRAYLIHGQSIHQISKDQSVVADLVKQGVINWNEAVHHPRRNQLNMSISARREVVEPFLAEVETAPGDKVLLCSDGLWSVIPEDQILYYVSHYPLQAAVDELIRQTCDYGAPDNVSIILAQQEL